MVTKIEVILFCFVSTLVQAQNVNREIPSIDLGQPFYNNPVIENSAPDPTVIRARDGLFYLYSTEDTRNVPIYKSENLVDWSFVGTAFDNNSHPNFFKDGRVWAPDINFIKGKYVMYYSLSKWGEHDENGIGIAISANPEGPFVDKGKLFLSKEIGVKNSIDPFYFEDRRKKYLFWGSLHGIYGIELSKDGMKVKSKSKIIKVAGSFMEATAVEKRNGYYYLFGSAGSCCKGADSKYHITYGRSKNLFGPYLTQSGEQLLDNQYDTLIMGNYWVAGPGHQSRIIQDDKGQDWLLYHGYLRDKPELRRLIFLDKVNWIDDWPKVVGMEPSRKTIAPYFKKKKINK